jgi:predicted KAP-like P-loop ATPase
MEEVDLNEVMAVLVAANRLGFATLVQHCERLLSMHLTDFFPQNAENCLEFAVAYNIPRLERQCREVLSKAPAKLAESRHAHAQGKSATGVAGVSGASVAAGDSGMAARKPWV